MKKLFIGIVFGVLGLSACASDTKAEKVVVTTTTVGPVTTTTVEPVTTTTVKPVTVTTAKPVTVTTAKPVTTTTTEPVKPVTTTTAEPVTTTTVPVYYANCDAVRSAGKAPLYSGQPGYRAGLDRDKDGVACDE